MPRKQVRRTFGRCRRTTVFLGENVDDATSGNARRRAGQDVVKRPLIGLATHIGSTGAGRECQLPHAIGGDAFDDALGHRRPDDSREMEAGRREQILPLLLGALEPAGIDQHFKVHELGQAWLIAWPDDLIDHQQLSGRLDRVAAVRQDLSSRARRPNRE